MAEAVIQLEDIHNRFGANVVHDGVDLEVRRGEVLGLVGGSGAGKTVLMHCMTLLRRPSSGRVRLFGEDVGRLAGSKEKRLRLRMGVMFQHGALFSGLTVLENIGLPLHEQTELSLATRERIGMLKLRLAGLPADAARKYPRELSGGMIKRAAIARSLALEPEILFLDEPTAGLDPVTAAAIDELVVELRDLLGLTVVLVTHDPDTLWRATDRVAFLAHHKLLEVAPIAQLAESEQPDIRHYFSGPRSRSGH